MTMKERLSDKIRRLDEASKIDVITGDKTAAITMQQISSISKTVVLHTDTAKVAVSIFAVNAALRILDEIEAMNCYFGFIKTRRTFIESLTEAMIVAGINIKNEYDFSDPEYTLISTEDLKSYRDKINAKKWMLQTSEAYFVKVGNYYVPLEQVFAVGINKSCVLSNNGISIEVDMVVTDVITEGKFSSYASSFYDAIRFNVADMVLDQE